jgi:integrase
MIKADLEAAEIPFFVNNKVYGFHALRHQFTTNLARSGVHPKVAQELARHSTIALSMSYHTHIDQTEKAVAAASCHC